MSIIKEAEQERDDPYSTLYKSEIIGGLLAEIERLTERCEAYKGQVKCGAAEIERLRAALWPFAAHFQFNAGYNDFDFKLASEAYGKIIVNEQQTNLTPDDSRRIKQAFIDDTKPAEQTSVKEGE